MIIQLIIKNDHRLDFNALGLSHPALFTHLLIINYKTTVDFSNPQSLRVLTQAILKYLCNINWSLPQGHLCPTIPSRLNYLEWLHQISEQPIMAVIDIGTGASLIYPILGSCLYGWKFTATEMDQQSIRNCEKILHANPELHDKIQIVNSGEKMLKGVISRQQQFSALISNPPFFSKEENTMSEMTANQHHTDEGQYGFFFKLYCQSLVFSKIGLFTCLIGRKKSFFDIKDMMDAEMGQGMLKFIRYGMIVQGNCQRYIIAWKPNCTPQL